VSESSGDVEGEESGLGGMRIVTVTVVVRAGSPEWSDIKTMCDVDAEPGWPQDVVLAAAQGGLKASLSAVKKAGRDGIPQDEDGQDAEDEEGPQ
jgi:hypothetical protein